MVYISVLMGTSIAGTIVGVMDYRRGQRDARGVHIYMKLNNRKMQKTLPLSKFLLFNLFLDCMLLGLIYSSLCACGKLHCCFFFSSFFAF